MRLGLAMIISFGMTASVNARELTAPEKNVIVSALTKNFRDPPSAEFVWTPWADSVTGDGAVMYCGAVNARGAGGNYEGYVPYLAAVLVRSGKIADAVLIGTNFPSPARAGSPMRQCIGKLGG